MKILEYLKKSNNFWINCSNNNVNVILFRW